MRFFLLRGREPKIRKAATVSQVDVSAQGKQQVPAERMKANSGVQPEKQIRDQSADEKQLEQLRGGTAKQKQIIGSSFGK